MEKTKEFQISGPELMSYDPIVILRDVMRGWLLILVSVIVVGVGVYIVSDKSYTPEYKTSTTLVKRTEEIPVMYIIIYLQHLIWLQYLQNY